MNARLRTILIHGSLFIVTFITTTIAGAEWTHGKSIFAPDYSWNDFASGLPYSICFLTILTVHEFGHYFTAIYYRINTSLPYFIPLPPLSLSVGTLGAMIRLRQRIITNKQQFDVGIAGPLAGFIAAVGFLIYGFVTLPPPEYIFQIHPEYQQYGLDYASHVYQQATAVNGKAAGIDIMIGKNLLFQLLEFIFADTSRMPNIHEIIHYPFLFAGFLSLVFTSMNLLPIGQLDGGHVLYGLVGFNKHRIIATVVYVGLILYCGLGLFSEPQPLSDLVWLGALYLFALYRVMFNFFTAQRDRIMYALLIFAAQYLVGWLFPAVHGYTGWLLFLLLVGIFAGVAHPPSPVEVPLDPKRKILGWIALFIFILCITPVPIELVPIVQP